MKDYTGEALDFLKDIVIIIVIVLVVRTYFIMPFKINGQSMASSYYDKEFIIVDRFSYRNIPLLGQTQNINRGDVIVFEPGVSDERKYFIKRIIGLPGEVIKIADGNVFIKEVGAVDFYQLEESQYLNDENLGNTTVRSDTTEINYQVPENRFFVMGDNRNHSTDSRSCFQSCSIRENYIGPTDIIGKVLLDLGYFNFTTFSFTQPELGIDTKPDFFSSPAEIRY